MDKKIYVSGNIFYVVDPTDGRVVGQDSATDVKITKELETGSTRYTIFSPRIEAFTIDFANIKDINGAAYSDGPTWENYYETNTGFKQPPGSSGGVQSVTGGAVDNTDPYNPVVNMVPFTEESTIISGSSSGTWVTRSLGGSYANKEIEMIVYRSEGTEITVGVREAGSTVPKFFPLGRGATRYEVKADGSGDIEILSTSNQATFEVTGTRPLT